MEKVKAHKAKNRPIIVGVLSSDVLLFALLQGEGLVRTVLALHGAKKRV
jgi:hypothetical protein